MADKRVADRIERILKLVILTLILPIWVPVILASWAGGLLWESIIVSFRNGRRDFA